MLFGSALGLVSGASAVAQTALGTPLLDTGGIPPGVILVKGAWASASDSVTPLPERGQVVDGTYSNAYFGLSYSLSTQWTERYSGPPPSDSGYIVMAQIEPSDEKSTMSGHILIAAQDLFFSLMPAANALEQIKYTSEHLAANYKVETAPRQVRIAHRSFVRLDYSAPASGLHWRVLATEMRCHVVQFVFTSRDPKLIDKLSAAMNSMKLSPEASATAGTGGGEAPVCIAGYAASDQRIAGENPILTEPRFNPIPVRIIIDSTGRVKHMHFLSAFPDQSKAITEALSQWRFKPYLVEGRAVEVETGIMFGRKPRQGLAPASATARGSVVD